MERTGTADTPASGAPPVPPLPRTGELPTLPQAGELSSVPGLPSVPRPGGLLDALPAQPRSPHPAAVPAVPAAAPGPPRTAPGRSRAALARWRTAPARFRAALTGLSPRLLLPTPGGTPFTFGYAVLLALTSLITRYADPALVHTLHQDSSTDVAHLLATPATVLLASALWVAGGFASPFVAGFLLVLTALERRTGALGAAAVFLLGHVLATLLTEGTVGIAVLAGRLPETSLHRLDYGISFGVAASVGGLAGLLRPWLRWPLLAVFGGMLAEDLWEFTDPMTNWGHLIALAIGVATWPLVRRWQRARALPPTAAVSLALS